MLPATYAEIRPIWRKPAQSGHIGKHECYIPRSLAPQFAVEKNLRGWRRRPSPFQVASVEEGGFRFKQADFETHIS